MKTVDIVDEMQIDFERESVVNLHWFQYPFQFPSVVLIRVATAKV